MKKDPFDVQHPMFKPLWRRIALTAFTAIWTGVEASNGNTFWAVLFGAISVYLAYQFFWAWNPPTDDADEKDKP